MCGEHWSRLDLGALSQGSSPHVRGAHRTCTRCPAAAGIIPACAGSTRFLASRHTQARDHPRMGGEHHLSGHSGLCRPGSSPHVRGAPGLEDDYPVPNGIIPACAGSTFGTEEGAPDTSGSSPHVRGAQNLAASRVVPPGIIPACAGSTPSSACPTLRRPGSSPHVRGAPVDCGTLGGGAGDHPRMCGEHHAADLVLQAVEGIIPACAGSTSSRPSGGLAHRNHPRMCGEHQTRGRSSAG